MLLNPDLAKLLLRLCVGGLMLFHGIFKITHGADVYVGMLESKGLPGLMAYGVYIGEVLAPLLIILGYQVRISALIVAFTMFMAIYLVYGFLTLMEAGLLNISFCISCLALRYFSWVVGNMHFLVRRFKEVLKINCFETCPKAL